MTPSTDHAAAVIIDRPGLSYAIITVTAESTVGGAEQPVGRQMWRGLMVDGTFYPLVLCKHVNANPQAMVEATDAALADVRAAIQALRQLTHVEPTLSEVEPSGPDEIVPLTSGYALHRYSRFWHLVDAEGTIEVWEDGKPDAVQITHALAALHSEPVPTPTPPTITGPFPPTTPIFANRVGEYDPTTRQYPAYVSIDGEPERLVGCAWSVGAADRLCDDFAFHYYADHHTPEVAAQIAVRMAEADKVPEPYCFFHPDAADHDTQHCPKLDEPAFGAPSYSVFN